MTTNKKFSAHDKRVTLHLAMLSACCQQIPGMVEALSKLPDLDWDVYRLPKPDIELLYAEFDESLEKRIRDEFIADPEYLIDYPHDHDCTLCGHKHIRYEFMIINTAGGTDVTCGSKCILTHGISVKGTETAEHARKALEQTLRRHIRKLKIEQWHKDAEFYSDLFHTLEAALRKLKATYIDPTLPHAERMALQTMRYSAFCKLEKDFPKLRRSYDRSGWLNTKVKWAEWSRLVWFARKHRPECRDELPAAKAFEEINPKLKVKSSKKAAEPKPEAEPTPEPAPEVEASTLTTPALGNMSKDILFG